MPPPIDYPGTDGLAPSEIFRFLDVRSPKLTLPNDESIVWVRPTTSVPSPFLYAILYAIKVSGDTDWLQQIKDAVDDYKAGTSGYKSIFRINTVFPNLYDISSYLEKNDLPFDTSAPPVRLTLREWLDDTYGIDVDTYFTTTILANKWILWDNLFAQALRPDQNGVGNFIMLCIRVLHLMQLAKDNNPIVDTIYGIRKMLREPVLLPESLFPISFRIADEAPRPDTPTAEDASEIDLYRQITEGIKELDFYFETQSDIIKGATPKPLQFDPSDPTNVDWLAYLAAIDAIDDQIRDLRKFESGDETDIGTNFTDAITTLGIDKFEGMDIFSIREQFSKKAGELFAKHSRSDEIEFRVKRLGNVVYIGDWKWDDIEVGTAGDLSSIEDRCKIKPLGTGYFYKVEQQLFGYGPSEVAHIENVMIGETRERATRRLERVEDISISETETTSEKEKDLQTTDRYEQQVNSSKVNEQNLDVDAGISTTAKYGAVNIAANLDASYGSSSTTALETATDHAKETTERSRQLTISRVRQERIIKILHEYEENNKHSFSNTGDSPINQVGIYRWIDKSYLNRLMNYGPHAMFEFMVPEPAFFHIFSKVVQTNSGEMELSKPVAPNDNTYSWPGTITPLNSFLDLNLINYSFWANLYGAAIQPPPDLQIVISKGISGGTDGVLSATSFNELEIPEGYIAVLWTMSGAVLYSPSSISIGGNGYWSSSTGSGGYNLHNVEGILGISVFASGVYEFSIAVTCYLKPETFAKWRADTYSKIMAAYNQKLADFNLALQRMKQDIDNETSFGTNPAMNREIEKKELKKACIEMLTKTYLSTISSIVDNGVTDDACKQPEISFCDAIENGKYIQFFEQAFEWEQITYIFYPYFWSRKCKWVEMYNRSDSDPLFQKFLQAGAARVVIPVRKGYEAVMMYYLETGVIWMGADAPVLTDPLYLSVANEIATIPERGWPQQEASWTTKLPTDLIALQCDSGCIVTEDGGLPNYTIEELDDAISLYDKTIAP